MFYRVISIFLSIALLVSALPLTAFATEESEHRHMYVSSITVDATCTQEGITTYQCECGDSFTQANPTQPHTFDGGVCTVCGTQEQTARNTWELPEVDATDENLPTDNEPQMPPPEILPQETAPEEPVPEVTTPEETTPKETTPEETVPEETFPEETIPEETVPEVTVPEVTVPEVTTPEETTPDDTASGITSPEVAPAEDFSWTTLTLESGEQAIKLTDYKGSAEAITIPSSIDGLPVRIIGSGTFSGNTTLTTLVIPEGVTKIEDRSGYYNSGATFYSCTALKTVVFPNSLTHIGSYSFYGCSALENVVFGSGVTTIGSYAFCDCTALENIDLGSSVTTIGNHAFYECTALKTVNLSPSLKTIESYAFNNCEALSEITLPFGLETIESGAFSGTGITKLELPDSVTEFSMSSTLTYIKWSAGIPVISSTAFQGCSALKTVIFPEGVTEIEDGSWEISVGILENTSYKFAPFYGCYSLENVILPDSLKRIGEMAFEDCTKLSNIRFGKGLEEIGSNAFSDCTALESITLDSAITDIGSGAFSDCTALKSITLGSGITSIGDYMFSDCTALENITLGSGIADIGSSAFSGCSALKTVALNPSLKTIGSSAFYNCESLTEINLPNGLETIGGSAFSGTGITKLELPDSVTEASLSGMGSKLTYIKWSAGIPVIPNATFQGFNVLKTVVIPEGVTEIADGSVEISVGILQSTAYTYTPFYKCYSLESIILPDSLKRIGKMAFEDCTKLSYIQFGKGLEEIGSSAFSGCPDPTLGVYYGSWGAQYAEEEGYEYIYLDRNGTVRVSLDGNGLAGSKLILTADQTRRVQTVGATDTYSFGGLQEGAVCTVTLVNSYGDVLAVAENIPIQKDTAVTLKPDKTPGNVHLTVLDENGNNVTDTIGLEWFRANGDAFSSGSVLTGVLEGTELRCVIRLNESQGRTMFAPEALTHVVTPGENALTVTLKRIPTATVTGTVTGQNGILAGATVVVKQVINGKYDLHTTAVTDLQGCYTLEIPAVAAQISVEAGGYIKKTLSVDTVSDNQVLETVALQPATGPKLTLHVTSVENAREGKEPVRQVLTSLTQMQVTVYNKTQKAYVENVVRDGMTLILADHAAVGDVLTVTLSADSSYLPAQQDVTLKANGTTAELEMVHHGSMYLQFNTSNRVHAIIYGQDGKLAWTGTTAENDLTLTTGTLPEGTYTVVLMEYSPLVTDPDSLDALKKSAMKQDRDYVQTEITVTAGKVSEHICRSVPKLRVENFSYTDPKASSYITNKTTVSAGKFFTLRANAQIARSYQGKLRNIKWVFVLPEGTEYYEGTLTVDGKAVEEYEYSGNTLVFPVEDPNLLVRFCANAVGQGEGISTAYLEFDLDGKTLRQSIGAVTVKIGDLEMELSGKTFTPEITVLGTAAGGADIMLYDGDVIIGQTKAAANGNWKIQGTLYNPGSYSVHDICAVMLLPTGTQVRSAVKQVVYQYSTEPVTVSKVTMFLGSSKNPAVVFDFLDPNAKLMSYSVVGGETFTYLVEFDCPDYEKLSDVKLEVSLTDGSTQTLDTVFDRERQAFVTSSFYSFNALPVNVAVSYDYDAELSFSQQHLEEVKAAAAEMDGFWQEWSEAMENLEASGIFEPLEFSVFPENTDVPVPQELIQAIEERNALAEQVQKAQENMTETLESLNINISTDQTGFDFSIGGMDIGFKQEELSQFSVADMVANGFSIYRVGNTEDLIFIRLLMDLETGEVIQQIIDTSADGQGMARLSADSYALKAIANDQEEAAMSNAYMTPADAPQYICAVPTVPKNINVVAESPKSGYYCTMEEAPIITETTPSQGNVNWNIIQKTIEVISAFGSTMDGSINLISECELAGLELAHAYKEALRLDFDTDYYKYEQERNPTIKAEMEKKLTKKWDAYKKIEKEIDAYKPKETTKMHQATQKLSKLAGILGAVTGVIDLANDVQKISKLNEIIETTGDNEAKIQRAQMIAKMALTTLGIIACFTPAAGLVCVSLFAFSTIAACVASNLESQTDRLLQKYAGGNASGSGQPAQPKIDPSGYIYEAVASNRLPGVTVTCYEKVTGYDMYDEPYTEIMVWDAEEYEQTNPLVTDAEGRYEWDVPQGWWQVKAELDGYETTYSDWLPVPPPQLEVNLAMVSYAVPQVESVTAAPRFVDITFSKYMRAELLVRKNITIYQGDTRITGKLELLDSEVNPLNSEEFFASQVRFIPSSTLQTGTEITISLSEDLCSYADVSVGSNVKLTATVKAQPETLQTDEAVTVEYLGQSTVTVRANPAAVCAGMTVSVTAPSLVQLSQTTVVLDENGCGQLTVTGKLPGEAELVFTLEGTKLESRTLISIPMPEAPSCDHNELTVQTHIYWETFTDNGDGQTHCRNAFEMNRLYCADCGTYLEQYHQGKYYPNSGEVQENLPHRFQEDICQDCGAVESKGIPGDADGDSFVTPIDAMLVLQFYVGDIPEAVLNTVAADVDGDGFTTPIDAMLILQYYVGDIVKFPVEG